MKIKTSAHTFELAERMQKELAALNVVVLIGEPNMIKIYLPEGAHVGDKDYYETFLAVFFDHCKIQLKHTTEFFFFHNNSEEPTVGLSIFPKNIN